MTAHHRDGIVDLGSFGLVEPVDDVNMAEFAECETDEATFDASPDHAEPAELVSRDDEQRES